MFQSNYLFTFLFLKRGSDYLHLSWIIFSQFWDVKKCLSNVSNDFLNINFIRNKLSSTFFWVLSEVQTNLPNFESYWLVQCNWFKFGKSRSIFENDQNHLFLALLKGYPWFKKFRNMSILNTTPFLHWDIASKKMGLIRWHWAKIILLTILTSWIMS